MLAQLPPHTVAKKVENYEHLDILWGRNVDKVVFPYVLDYLKMYAEPPDGSKALDSGSQHSDGIEAKHPPAYSPGHSHGLRKRGAEASQQEGVSYSAVAAGDSKQHTETKEPASYAEAAKEIADHDGSDSDRTIEEDHDAKIKPGVSFAEVAKVDKTDDTVSPKTEVQDEKSVAFGAFSDTANRTRSGTWGVSYEEAAWAAIINDKDNTSPLLYTNVISSAK
jgi:hypothetical protein